MQTLHLRATPPPVDDAELLALATAAENPSEHPLARAIVDAARDAGLTRQPAEDFGSAPGHGVRARIGEDLVEVGNPTLLPAVLEIAHEMVDDLEQTGHTAVVVRLNGTVVGMLGLTDRVRDAAADMVAALTELTGAQPILLTGDNPRAAAALGMFNDSAVG